MIKGKKNISEINRRKSSKASTTMALRINDSSAKTKATFFIIRNFLRDIPQP
jgi:hypothetical protein